jgi:hypothetical protein
MERLPPDWLAAIALTTLSILVGASVVFVDGAVLGSDLTPTLVVLGGLVTVLAALAASGSSPLTDG